MPWPRQLIRGEGLAFQAHAPEGLQMRALPQCGTPEKFLTFENYN